MIVCTPHRRAALLKWKEKNGSKATYECLTSAFERAGNQQFAELVISRNPMKKQSCDATEHSKDHEASASLVLSQPPTYPLDHPPEFPCAHLNPVSPEPFMLTDEIVAPECVSKG